MKNAVACFVALLFLFSAPVFAQTTNTNQTATQTNLVERQIEDTKNRARNLLPSYPSFLLRAVITLAIFAVILFFLYRFIKNRSAALGTTSADIVEVLSINTVAPNKHVCIIKVAERVYMLGISDNNMNMLSEIEDEVTKSFIITKASVAQTDTTIGFGDIVSNLLAGFGIKDKKKEPLDATEELKNRIRELGKKDSDH